MLAQRAGYQTLNLEGLTTPAQWAAAAAASVRNADALENAMMQVILAATAIKLVARPSLHSQGSAYCMGSLQSSYRASIDSVHVWRLSDSGACVAAV